VAKISGSLANTNFFKATHALLEIIGHWEREKKVKSSVSGNNNLCSIVERCVTFTLVYYSMSEAAAAAGLLELECSF
jgi:hypothetical protein